jgi:hypothetical protein
MVDMFPRKTRRRIDGTSNGTLVHSSHICAQRRIVMNGARPDDSLSKCMGIIRSVRLAAGRTIRHLFFEMNAPVAIAKEVAFRIVLLSEGTGTFHWLSAIYPCCKEIHFRVNRLSVYMKNLEQNN